MCKGAVPELNGVDRIEAGLHGVQPALWHVQAELLY